MRTKTLLIVTSILLIGALPYTQYQSTGQNDHRRHYFELGVQIGHAERDALDADSPERLKQRLRFVEQLVSEIDDPDVTTELDALIRQLDTARNSDDIYLKIQLFRQQLSWSLRHPYDEVRPEDLPSFKKGVEATRFEEPETPQSASWEGIWETSWGIMTIVEHENGVLTGHYGSSKHSIEGRVDPDDPRVFAGTWTHTGSTSTGRLRFEMTSRNTFEGAWTSGNSPPSEVGVNWTGTRLDNIERLPTGLPEQIEGPNEGEFPTEGDHAGQEAVAP